MAPAVPPWTKVWRAITSIRPQCCRNFRDTEIEQCGLDHHFGRELHATGAQFQPVIRRAGKRSEPAVEIPDRAPKEKSTQSGKHRVSDVAVFPWHRARLHSAEE